MAQPPSPCYFLEAPTAKSSVQGGVRTPLNWGSSIFLVALASLHGQPGEVTGQRAAPALAALGAKGFGRPADRPPHPTRAASPGI